MKKALDTDTDGRLFVRRPSLFPLLRIRLLCHFAIINTSHTPAFSFINNILLI